MARMDVEKPGQDPPDQASRAEGIGARQPFRSLNDGIAVVTPCGKPDYAMITVLQLHCGAVPAVTDPGSA
jgi:hypothetical protein